MSSSGISADEITVAAPPTTPGVTSQMLATMAALSGIITDYNIGSQIRTMAEAQGSVIEEQGIWAQALAYQSMVYGALQLFGVAPGQATFASGVATFATSQGVSPPPSPQSTPIPIGTIVQTNGGVQYSTTTAATLVSGASSINVPIQAINAGTAGNAPAGSLAFIITGLTAPLFVSNTTVLQGGSNAPPLSLALAEFAALVASIPAATPVAIANAAIGVANGAEICQYSTVYEPWIAAGSGAGSGTAGWTLIIDNGTGTASSGLVAAVNAVITGGTVSGASNASGAVGYRDAGVPYSILSVSATPAVISVSATLVNANNQTVVNAAIASAVSGYFTLPFGAPAQQAQIATSIANALAGQISALAVALMASGSITPVTGLAPSVSGRMILGLLTTSITL